MHRKNLGRVGIVGAVVAALVLGPALAASAASTEISSTVNCYGALNQYDIYRYHASGSASFNLKHKDFPDEFRIGLRLQGDSTQYTNSLSFLSDGVTKTFTRASNGSTTLGSGYYAVNARAPQGTASCAWTGWNGTLNL